MKKIFFKSLSVFMSFVLLISASCIGGPFFSASADNIEVIQGVSVSVRSNDIATNGSMEDVEEKSKVENILVDDDSRFIFKRVPFNSHCTDALFLDFDFISPCNISQINLASSIDSDNSYPERAVKKVNLTFLLNGRTVKKAEYSNLNASNELNVISLGKDVLCNKIQMNLSLCEKSNRTMSIRYIGFLGTETGKHTVTTAVSPENSGIVTGEKTYYENESVTLKATPNKEYYFNNWDNNPMLTNESLTFKMGTTDVTHTAYFKKKAVINLDGQGADVTGTLLVYIKPGDKLPSVTVPQKNGYDFLGYYELPDGVGRQFYDGFGISTEERLTSDTTIYACWKYDGNLNYKKGFKQIDNFENSNYAVNGKRTIEFGGCQNSNTAQIASIQKSEGEYSLKTLMGSGKYSGSMGNFSLNYENPVDLSIYDSIGFSYFCSVIPDAPLYIDFCTSGDDGFQVVIQPSDLKLNVWTNVTLTKNPLSTVEASGDFKKAENVSASWENIKKINLRFIKSGGTNDRFVAVYFDNLFAYNDYTAPTVESFDSIDGGYDSKWDRISIQNGSPVLSLVESCDTENITEFSKSSIGQALYFEDSNIFKNPKSGKYGTSVIAGSSFNIKLKNGYSDFSKTESFAIDIKIKDITQQTKNAVLNISFFDQRYDLSHGFDWSVPMESITAQEEWTTLILNRSDFVASVVSGKMSWEKINCVNIGFSVSADTDTTDAAGISMYLDNLRTVKNEQIKTGQNKLPCPVLWNISKWENNPAYGLSKTENINVIPESDRVNIACDQTVRPEKLDIKLVNGFDIEGYNTLCFSVMLSENSPKNRFKVIVSSSLSAENGYELTVTETQLSQLKTGQWDTLKIKCPEQENSDSVNWHKIRRITLVFDAPADFSIQKIHTEVDGSCGNGDIDCDGIVTSSDALKVLQASIEIDYLSTMQKFVGDVDKNKNINTIDGLQVLQFSIGIISSFKEDYDHPTVIIDQSDRLYIPDTTFENGAYSDDITSDNSYTSTTEGLMEKTVYLFKPSVFTDPKTSKYDPHLERLVVSLQGIVNRDFGLVDANGKQHTSLIYICKNSSSDDADWLDFMMSQGVYEGFSTKNILSWDSFVTDFLPQLKQCGYVSWDPKVPATANVATTVCGIDGYLPVMKYSRAETLLSNAGIVEKMSLVDMFTIKSQNEKITDTNVNSTGSPKSDAYLWAVDKYLNKCSSQFLGYMLDGITSICCFDDSKTPAEVVRQSGYNNYGYSKVDSTMFPNANQINNIDYFIARRSFVFDLDPLPEISCDARYYNGNNYASMYVRQNSDYNTFCTIMQSIDNRNRQGGHDDFIKMIGFPPWWEKYTMDATGSSNIRRGTEDAVSTEWYFMELIAGYNAATEGDALSYTAMNNGSAYYKYRVVSKEFINNTTPKVTDYDPNTLYYTFYMGDYDSGVWVKEHFYKFFADSDSKHGQYPLTWPFNPVLYYRFPVMVDFLNQYQTANDNFCAGEGAGYLIPQKITSDGIARWINYSQRLYGLFKMDITGFIIQGHYSLNSAILDTYGLFSSKGAFLNQNITGFRNIKNVQVPFVYCQNIDGSESYKRSGADLTNFINSSATTMLIHVNGKKFAAFRTVLFNTTGIDLLINRFESFVGRKAQLVDNYTYMELYKKSGLLPYIN